MDYREFAPAPVLAPFIACYWTLGGAAGDEERIIPDGRVDLVLNFGDPFERRRAANRERQPLALLAGQGRVPVFIRPTGRVDLLGVRFRPDGAAALLALPLDHATDRIADLGALEPALRGLLERLGNSPAAARTTLLDTLLQQRLRERRPDERVTAAVAAITLAAGTAAIDPLTRTLGLGRRQLERLFLRDVGLPPKAFARIVRVQAVIRAARSTSPAAWATIAARFRYTDQSHLIRDFHTLTGTTPAAFFQPTTPPALFLDR
jgi:AraC-like DNA-binding protein